MSINEAPQHGFPHEDRRKNQRVALLTQVECVGNGEYIVGFTRDISKSGLSVEAKASFNVGTEVVVRFILPPYPPGTLMEIQGVVLWVRPAESMGIGFQSLEYGQHDAIAKYIQLHGRITELGPL
jgi:hypothetical protein